MPHRERHLGIESPRGVAGLFRFLTAPGGLVERWSGFLLCGCSSRIAGLRGQANGAEYEEARQDGGGANRGDAVGQFCLAAAPGVEEAADSGEELAFEEGHGLQIADPHGPLAEVREQRRIVGRGDPFGQDVIVADLLPLLGELPAGPPYEGMKEVHGLDEPLEQVDPGVTPGQVCQLVRQDHPETLWRPTLVHLFRQQNHRPQEAKTDRAVQLPSQADGEPVATPSVAHLSLGRGCRRQADPA